MMECPSLIKYILMGRLYDKENSRNQLQQSLNSELHILHACMYGTMGRERGKGRREGGRERERKREREREDLNVA